MERLPLIFGIVSITCIVFAIFFIYQSVQQHEPIEFVMGESTASGTIESQRTIRVDVAGGVVKPGVYTLSVGARMDDAIEKAGGLSKEASIDLVEKAINRAQRVQDGAKIYVPKKKDETLKVDTSHNSNARRDNEENNTSHNLGITSQDGGLISVNSASQSELESLPGVGPATAGKIINGRPYTSLEELISKKVVGQKLFEKLQSQLSL